MHVLMVSYFMDFAIPVNRSRQSKKQKQSGIHSIVNTNHKSENEYFHHHPIP
jgi:hypothetical protein